MRCPLLVAVSVTCLASPTAGQSALTPAQYRADIAQLRLALDNTERSWPPGAKPIALQRLDALAAAADTVRAAYFHLEISRIVALADNGHTVVPAPSRANRFTRIPVRLAPLGDHFYVVRASRAHETLRGARLLAIDGRGIDTLRNIARTLNGGSTAWRDRFVPVFLESPQQMQALGATGDTVAATYRFQLLDGRIVEQRLTAEAADTSAMVVGTSRWLYPETNVTGADHLEPLLSQEAAPWALQEAGTPFRWREAREIDGLVIELRATIDQGSQRIRPFLERMQEELRQRKPRNVVLDLRNNGGGDLTTARAFVQALPTLVPGRLFVLTSPYTFSAAISTVGYLKQAAPERVSIVGEEVGDRLEFWAEGRPILLQHSRIRVGVATERHDYRNGCRAFRDCHGNVVSHPIAVPGLMPDIPAAWTIDDYRSGRDPAMAAVRARLFPGAVP